MSNFPNLGPEEKRPGEVSRVSGESSLAAFGQGIEKVIRIFNEFGDMIDRIVIKSQPATGSIEMINKKMDEMRVIFGSQVTHIDAFNESMTNLQRLLSVRTLTEGMANATDSVDNFNKVLELMQQNLDANVVTAKVGRLRALEKELTDIDVAEKQKKRDKERDKSILGISGAAVALKAFNKVIAPFKQGMASLESGFNKNMAVIFDSLENLGEALGRPFLDTFETWAGAIDDVTEGVLTRQDAWDSFGTSINEIGNLLTDFPDLREDFLGQFVELRDLLRTFQVSGVSAIDEQQFLTSAGLASDLLSDIQTRIQTDADILEELRNQSEILQVFVDIVATDPAFRSGSTPLSAGQGLFGGLFG